MLLLPAAEPPDVAPEEEDVGLGAEVAAGLGLGLAWVDCGVEVEDCGFDAVVDEPFVVPVPPPEVVSASAGAFVPAAGLASAAFTIA